MPSRKPRSIWLITSGGVPAGATIPKPADGFKSAQALLRQRRNVGQENDALGGRDPERFQLTLLDQLLGRAGYPAPPSGMWPARTSTVAGAVPR